jgi:hypothetical protein
MCFIIEGRAAGGDGHAQTARSGCGHRIAGVGDDGSGCRDKFGTEKQIGLISPTSIFVKGQR